MTDTTGKGTPEPSGAKSAATANLGAKPSVPAAAPKARNKKMSLAEMLVGTVLADRYKLAIEIHPYDGEKFIQLQNRAWRFHLIWMLAQCADAYHFYTLDGLYVVKTDGLAAGNGHEGVLALEAIHRETGAIHRDGVTQRALREREDRAADEQLLTAAPRKHGRDGAHILDESGEHQAPTRWGRLYSSNTSGPRDVVRGPSRRSASERRSSGEPPIQDRPPGTTTPAT